MKEVARPELSVVVPVYNEGVGLARFHESLRAALGTLRLTHEILYVDDGSGDDSGAILSGLAHGNVKLVSLSRNFGKEYALTAGINQADGLAVLTIDADGQHPVGLIGRFVEAWQDGADIVVGVRRGATSLSSRLFYRLFNRLTGERLVPHSTDFRLIDRRVADAFRELGESNRITRGLIDWLGFRRTLVEFEAGRREHGTASYSGRQLRRLAVDSFVSLSSVPLFLFGWLGIFITLGGGLLGLAVLVEQIILGDPLGWHFTGTAMLGTLILFLIGIVLMSQGMIALYVSHVHTQSKGRPLYVIDRSRSVGLD